MKKILFIAVLSMAMTPLVFAGKCTDFILALFSCCKRRHPVALSSAHESLAQSKTSQLYNACFCGDVVSAKALIDESPEVIDAITVYGWTPLMIAAYQLHPEVVKLLIERGADLNTRGVTIRIDPSTLKGLTKYYSDRSALELAFCADEQGPETEERLVQVVKLLLDAKPDLSPRAYDGVTIVHQVMSAGIPLSVSRLVLYHPQVVESGFGINNRDFLGNTPLHWAIRSANAGTGNFMCDSYQKIELLVSDAQCKPVIKNNGDEDAMDLALRYGDATAARILLGRYRPQSDAQRHELFRKFKLEFHEQRRHRAGERLNRVVSIIRVANVARAHELA